MLILNLKEFLLKLISRGRNHSLVQHKPDGYDNVQTPQTLNPRLLVSSHRFRPEQLRPNNNLHLLSKDPRLQEQIS